MFQKNLLRSLLCIILYMFCTTLSTKPFILMLDPAGDAKNTGRKLDDSFERGVTLQLAEQLKLSLEKEYPHLRVILTRIAGETVEPLQNAQFANRLEADLYVSLCVYQETNVQPSLYLYTYSQDTATQRELLRHSPANSCDLALYRYDNAYLQHKKETITFGNRLQEIFNQHRYKNTFNFKGNYELPCKPLIGVQAPAFLIEMGYKNTHTLDLMIELMTNALGAVIPKNT